MRKKMIALFLCISTVAALSGCGSSKNSTSTGNADSAEKLVKLGDYKNIEVEVDKSYEISDNSVQETIENYFLTAPIYTENKEKDTVADGDVVFKVTINSIQDESYPTYDTLTDEYVKDNYNDYYGVSTVEELKKYVSDSLENNNNSAVGDALTDKLKEISKISDIPDSLTKERTKELKSYYKGMAKYQDQEFADFLQNTYGMSEDDFNKQLKELMPDYIKSDLVWEAVAAKEGIKASGEDYDKFVDKMMSTLKFDKKDDLFDVYPETMVKRMYIEQEAKDKLIKQAKVKYVETTSEDTTEQTQSDGSEDTGNTDNTSENAEVKDTIDTTTGK